MSSPAEKDLKPNYKPNFRITEIKGDLFTLPPPNSILLHAVNCRGLWGYGVAKSFKQHFPDAFAIYASHCQKTPPDELIGTTLLTPPHGDSKGNERHCWVGCLFTSVDYGRRVDKPEHILEHTRAALGDLRRQMEDLRDEVGALYAPRFNSGAFKVEWERTRKVIEEVFIGFEGRLTIVTYAE